MKKERKTNIFYKFAFALFFLMVCINTKAVNVSAASAEVSIRASSGFKRGYSLCDNHDKFI